MKSRELSLVFLFFLPLWVCISGRLLGLDSVGPAVPVTFFVNLLVLPFVLFPIIGVTNVWLRGLVTIFISVAVAYFCFISYMYLTPLFGVDNFHWI